MNRDIASEIASDFYPGSQKRRKAVLNASKAEAENDRWDAHPWIYHVNGEPVELFTIGALAKALDREAVTIRKWERLGYIPAQTTRAAAVTDHGRRRLYTREQIVGLMRLAEQEGLYTGTHVSRSKFPARAQALFDRLEEISQP